MAKTTRTFRTCDGDVLDTICYAVYVPVTRMVEAVYEANPGLVALVQPFVAGIVITLQDVDAPKGATAVHAERHAFASHEAEKAAAAALQKLNHHTAKSAMSMQGRADFSAEKSVTLKGFKKEADADFLVESVTHDYAGRSWETRVELNAGNTGKVKVGHGKKATKQINFVVPSPPH